MEWLKEQVDDASVLDQLPKKSLGYVRVAIYGYSRARNVLKLSKKTVAQALPSVVGRIAKFTADTYGIGVGEPSVALNQVDRADRGKLVRFGQGLACLEALRQSGHKLQGEKAEEFSRQVFLMPSVFIVQGFDHDLLEYLRLNKPAVITALYDATGQKSHSLFLTMLADQTPVPSAIANIVVDELKSNIQGNKAVSALKVAVATFNEKTGLPKFRRAKISMAGSGQLLSTPIVRVGGTETSGFAGGHEGS